jgi:RNA polymerase sigma-70 factor (ECF subfamily)
MRDEQTRQAIRDAAAAAATGDRDAFRRFVELTHATVYRLAYRLLDDSAAAEDVAQEAYLRAWQGLGSLRDPGAAFGWLCRVARNVAHDRQRRQYRQPTRSLDAMVRANGEATGPTLLQRLADPSADPEGQLDQAQLGAAVRAALQELNEPQRLVLTLREMDQMGYEEIAVALGIRLGTVESRLHRARKALAKKLRRLAREREQGER